MILKMFPENIIYQIFNFFLYCILIYLVLHMTLAHILNLTYKSKTDREIEGKLISIYRYFASMSII